MLVGKLAAALAARLAATNVTAFSGVDLDEAPLVRQSSG
jgi:hypothetical protein